MGWDRNILTDSGGFQMVSLIHLTTLTEEGVEFAYPHDQTRKLMMTPEESVEFLTCKPENQGKNKCEREPFIGDC